MNKSMRSYLKGIIKKNFLKSVKYFLSLIYFSVAESPTDVSGYCYYFHEDVDR